MIVDLILDRKDAEEAGEANSYNAREFYWCLMGYGEVFPELADPITRAMDGGTEADVKRALCDYIRNNDYNPEICSYIESREWLEEEA